MRLYNITVKGLLQLITGLRAIEMLSETSKECNLNATSVPAINQKVQYE